MPLSYEIDTKHRLVIAKGHGVLTYEDLIAYQTDVWSRREVLGFDEIVDVSDVDKIAYDSPRQVSALADHAASLDSERETHLAIVAPDYGAYGLARMYQIFRGLQSKCPKKVEVFRSFDQASLWIARERGLACQARSVTEEPVK